MTLFVTLKLNKERKQTFLTPFPDLHARQHLVQILLFSTHLWNVCTTGVELGRQERERQHQRGNLSFGQHLI